MAPKRSAPPPPPPPVESSEETGSGSGSYESESESEEEEEIANSAPLAAPKNTAPPPQKVQQPEASSSSEEEEEEDEDEDVEEEEDEENVEEEDVEEQEEKEEGQEEEEDSESEEDEEEAPVPKSAPKQKVQGEGMKPLPSSKDKEPSKRAWSKEDEIRILETLAAHRKEHGMLPQPEALEAALDGKLANKNYSRKDLESKQRTLKALYTRTLKKADPPSDEIDRQIFDLSKGVWGDSDKPANDAVPSDFRDKPANDTVPSDFGELCKMYPYLGEELKEVQKTHPGLFKREFSKIHNDKACELDKKIKRQRVSHMKLELRKIDMTKQVTKVLMELAD
ncbi:hypothetical protein QOZ80_9AG0675040 [Eleusine coracana subsp. coracana]|nr:hypothetical protein QOZ80_9AG0675040 [Eleusine coracana subsp. coracana]